jgi:hypothetical protein
MPERPLLKLPLPVPFDPKPGPRGGGSLVKPQKDRQGSRIAPRFDRLMRVADDPQALMALRDDPASIAPERALVFEVAGQLKDFYAQARLRTHSLSQKMTVAASVMAAMKMSAQRS